MSSSVVSDKKNDPSVVLKQAVTKALDRKRRLGQYWVVWDGEKPVEIHPEDTSKTAAE